MSTITLPQTTIHAGNTTVGTWNLPTGMTSADVLLSRTISGGLNSLPSTATLELRWFLSVNGGAFVFQGGALFDGGIIPDPDNNNNPMTIAEIEVSGLPDPTASRQMQVQATASQQVKVSGTVTLSNE